MELRGKVIVLCTAERAMTLLPDIYEPDAHVDNTELWYKLIKASVMAYKGKQASINLVPV